MELNVTQINYYFSENNHPASAKVSFAGKQGDNSINATIYVDQNDINNDYAFYELTQEDVIDLAKTKMKR